MIGWDYHFNSWGNVVMAGFTGMLAQNYDGTWTAGNNRPQGYETNTLTEQYFEQTYSGTNNPAVVYDTTTNKFGFEYLHTPENCVTFLHKFQIHKPGQPQVKPCQGRYNV